LTRQAKVSAKLILAPGQPSGPGGSSRTLYRELPPAQRRRLVFWAVLRGVLGTTVLVVLYYVLPLDQPWNGDTAVRILIGPRLVHKHQALPTF